MGQLLARNRFRHARLLLVLAVLCVAGLQVQESTHYHAADDGLSHCLLCKSSADSPVLVTELAVFAVGQRTDWLVDIPPSAALEPLLPFNPRGPPAIS